MAETNQSTVPVGTRHSFSIELECLVAYVPTGGRDPDEFTTQGLPPLLLVDFSNEVEETAVLAHILNTFNSHGIPVISQPSEPTQSSVSSADDIDPSKWIVAAASSTNEYFLEGYFWQFIKIRSPVMWSQEAAFERIQFVVNLLTSTYRLRVNPTCKFGVHVGDGTRLFTAATIKRLGAFLWAADPIFSRLHAPWRRIQDSSRSIRLDSALARGTTTEQVLKKREGEFHEEYDPIPMTEFSNTSREETEYGGKEGWAEYARWRNEAGPFITLGEDIDEADRNGGVSDDSDGNDSSNNDTINGGSNESSSDDDDEWQTESFDENAESEPRLPSPRGVLDKWQRALEEDRQIPVPPDPNTLHRNIGWVAWDTLQDERVCVWLYQYCQDYYGHTKLYKLPGKEQITVMLKAQCALLYGHADIRLLDADQEYEILVAASQYIAAGRSSWEWNAETERWNLAWRRVGNILRHPAAHREIKIDAPSIVQNFENLAKLTDFHNEDNQLGIEYVSPQDYDEAVLTNKGIEKMLHDLKSYAQPPDPNFMANLADPQQEGWSDDGRSTHSSDGSYVMSKTEEQITELLPKDFDYELWAILLIEIQDACRVKGLRSEHSSDISWPVSFPSVETAPLWLSNTSPSTRGQKIADIWTYIEGVETATPRPETPMPKTLVPKLRPHNPDDLGTPYKASINKLVPIVEEEWDRSGYPLSSNNPHSDPTITAEQGIAELSSCDAAATAAELLSHPGPPLNYDFAPYTLSSLNSNQDQNQNQNQQQHGATVTHRSISFREAAGSLDAKWITTWVRICVGVVGWARRATADEYVRILDRVTAQGQRELRRAGAGPGYPGEERDEAERYDVCMLLEDLGLFAEAAWVWRREQERGPPR